MCEQYGPCPQHRPNVTRLRPLRQPRADYPARAQAVRDFLDWVEERAAQMPPAPPEPLPGISPCLARAMAACWSTGQFIPPLEYPSQP